MEHWIVHDLPVYLVWVTFGYQMKQIIVVRRRRKREQAILLAEIADEHQLTPLQAQVALDAAQTAFLTRVAEMREASSDGGTERH